MSQSILAQRAQIKGLELSIASPGAEWHQRERTGLTSNVLRTLSSADGDKIQVSIKPKRGKFLFSNLKETLASLVTEETAISRAVLLLEDEHGQKHPINLIARHLSTSKSVAMEGKYPNTDSMYENLYKAYEEHRETFDGMFT
ncbi:MAG: hypothetical protein G8345_04195 [Magnetococcales bacterium]|nr:hypothetical protein [Magnetococcales bacterium]